MPKTFLTSTLLVNRVITEIQIRDHIVGQSISSLHDLVLEGVEVSNAESVSGGSEQTTHQAMGFYLPLAGFCFIFGFFHICWKSWLATRAILETSLLSPWRLPLMVADSNCGAGLGWLGWDGMPEFRNPRYRSTCQDGIRCWGRWGCTCSAVHCVREGGGAAVWDKTMREDAI